MTNPLFISDKVWEHYAEIIALEDLEKNYNQDEISQDALEHPKEFKL